MLALHVAVIALIMFTRPIVSARAGPGLIAFDVPSVGRRASPAASAHPIEPRVVSARAKLPAAAIQLAQVDVPASLAEPMPVGGTPLTEMPAAIGGGCDLTSQVQDALLQSEEIRRELPTIPAANRSIANAVMVWNAGWVNSDPDPAQTALPAIRRMIEQLVAASSADCRNQRMVGPRLIYLPGVSGRTTVLAVGSGEWTWQQLIAGSPAGDLPPIGEITQVATTPALFAPAPHASLSPAPDQTPGLNAMLASLVGKRLPGGTPYYP